MPQHNQPVTAKVTTLPPIPNPYATAIAAGAVATPAAAPQSAAAPPPQAPSAGPSSTPAAVLTATQIGSARDKKLAIPQSFLGDDPTAPWQEKVKRLIREFCRTENFDCELDETEEFCIINFKSEIVAWFFLISFPKVMRSDIATQFVWAKKDFLEWKKNGFNFIRPISPDNYLYYQVANKTKIYSSHAKITRVCGSYASNTVHQGQKVLSADYKAEIEKYEKFAAMEDNFAKTQANEIAQFTGVAYTIENGPDFSRQKFYTIYYREQKDAEIACKLAKASKHLAKHDDRFKPVVNVSKKVLKIYFDDDYVIFSSKICLSGDSLLSELLQIQLFPVLWKDHNGTTPKFFIEEEKLGIRFYIEDEMTRFLDLYPKDKDKFEIKPKNKVFLKKTNNLTPIINRAQVLLKRLLLPQTHLLCRVSTKDISQLADLKESIDKKPWYKSLDSDSKYLNKDSKSWSELSTEEKMQLFNSVLIKNYAMIFVKYKINFDFKAEKFDIVFSQVHDAELFCRTFAPMLKVKIEKKGTGKFQDIKPQEDATPDELLTILDKSLDGSIKPVEEMVDVTIVRIPYQQMLDIGECLDQNIPFYTLAEITRQFELQASVKVTASAASGLAAKAATPVGDTATAAAGSDAKIAPPPSSSCAIA